MNKKFMNAMLFGALTLSAGSFVGCSDYDDDIDSLNTRVDQVETSIADLKKQISEGKWVKSFAPNATNTGYILTLSDNTPLEIKNGVDGIGKNGTSWEIDPETKNWIMVNAEGKKTDTGVCAEGKSATSTDGKDGKSPYIDATSGNWMVYDAEKGEFVDSEVAAAGQSSYVVEYKLYWELNMVTYVDGKASVDENGKVVYTAIKLPKSAAITNIDVISSRYTPASTVFVNLNQGKVPTGTKAFTFNGTEYTAEQLLLPKKKASFNAQINPVEAQADLYTFELTDSKGNSYFTVDAKALTSAKPLTRAAAEEETPNEGLYNMSVQLKEGLDMTDVENGFLCALATKDINGNTIKSNYAVAAYVYVNATLDAPSIVAAATCGINEDYDLTSNVANLENVADYYFEISDEDVTKCGITYDKQTGDLKATTEGIVTVKLHYLTLQGAVAKTEQQLTIKYAAGEIDLGSVEWKASDAAAVVDANALKSIIGDNFDKFSVETKAYSIAGVEDVNKAGYTASSLVKDENGNLSIKVTMDKTTVYLKDYTITLNLNDSRNSDASLNNKTVKTLKVVVNVKNGTSFKLVEKEAFFDAAKENAFAIGNVEVAGTTVSYDLYDLFETVADAAKANITFSEVRPEKTVNDVKITAPAWLASATSSTISVEKAPNFGGVSEARAMTISYKPFGNARLAYDVKKFKLTVRSEVSKVAYTGKSLSFKATGSGDVLANAVSISTINGATKDMSWDKVKAVTIKGDANAEKYLSYATTLPADVKDGKITGKVTVSAKSSQTAVITAVPCVLTIEVEDAWGVKTTTTVGVTLEASDL